MTGRHVVVIGGGLAGISAAIELREAGAGVTLLEARPWLGGATCSFSRRGLAIDNGQHVFLRCCTAYRELLARLGMTGSVTIQDRFDVTVLTAGGQAARLRRSGLPAPLHLARALAAYPLLPPADRLRAVRGALALRLARPGAAGLQAERLGPWLSARGQSERARRRLWDLFIVSSLNISGEEASVALAAKVIRTALLDSRDAADIGVPAIPLGQLHGEPAVALLRRLGAVVRLGAKAAALVPGPSGGFTVRVGAPGSDVTGHASGEEVHADGVVLAVPAWSAARLAGPVEPSSARWAELGSSPIVNVHVIYDRRVTRLPFAAAVDSPVQWVFDKTRQAGAAAGQYLAVSVSAADDYVDAPAARLRELFLPALAGLFPEARQASVTDYFVTRERRATFRQDPACNGIRPGPATSVSGLVVAGSWTDTGWPDTMEGAVRSGLTAARQMKRELARMAPPPGYGPPGRRSAPAPAGAAS